MDKENTNTLTVNPAVIGTYEGECADANITNENGLDITRPVWENVFNSSDYAQAIELGWYIGFLGHPEDPNCMDFEHACIVMTEGHIDENGKIYGKFNLIDTPVGRVVKAFQSAGVQFGISVRGAGDIIANSVDPDTFVFRGFDLVTFPAFPESIPTFSEIAASTDSKSQAKYKKICKTVNQELNAINSVESLDVMQSLFASQSTEYKALEKRKQSISASTTDTDTDIREEKIRGLTQLYLDEHTKCIKLSKMLSECKAQIFAATAANDKKMSTMKRIQNTQITAANKLIEDVSKENTQLIEANTKIQNELSKVTSSNLIYRQKIDSHKDDIRSRDKVLASLRSEKFKTVDELDTIKTKASNLDEQNRELAKQIEAAEQLIASYQSAYADIYASALGINLDKISATKDTTVSQLQEYIREATNTCNMSNVFVQPEPFDIVDEDPEDTESLVTM